MMKRSRSRSPSLPPATTDSEPASKKLRSAIALVASGASSETVSPVVDLLSAAHRQVLEFEAAPKIAIPLERLLSLSDLELKVIGDFTKAWKTLVENGFKVRPWEKDGGYDFTVWYVGIPGKEGTPYGGGLYPMTMTFCEDYPAAAPKCKFRPGFFHMNCYPSGAWQPYRLTRDGKDWNNSAGLHMTLLDIQWHLCHPDVANPAASDPYTLAKNDHDAYEARIREQVQEYAIPRQKLGDH